VEGDIVTGMYKKRFEVLKAVKMPIAVCDVIWIL
jgi:hypothetical protein